MAIWSSSRPWPQRTRNSLETLLRRTAQRIEIAPFADNVEPQVLPVKEVAWLARILWVSQ